MIIKNSPIDSKSSGGASIIEFTNRGDRAIDVFGELAVYRDRELPEMILGTGSRLFLFFLKQILRFGYDTDATFHWQYFYGYFSYLARF